MITMKKKMITMKNKILNKLRAPVFLYRQCCKTCKYKQSHLFDMHEFVNCCADINGTFITTVVPWLLWKVNWCKLYKKENKDE